MPRTARTGTITRRVRPLSLASALVLCSAVAAGAQFDPSVFFVVPEAPAQGDIVRVTMNMPKGTRAGTVTFLGRTYPGFVTGGLLNVYVGIDMDTDPGAHPIRYQFGDVGGARDLTVNEKLFDTERLTVPSMYTDLDPETLARVNAEASQLDAIWKTVSPMRLWSKSFVKPAQGPNGSPFGLRRFFNGLPRRPHAGLDIKAPEGSEVYASNQGRVVLAGDLFFTGNTVILDHGFGLYTLYAHLQRIDVAEGVDVKRSQRLGLVGKTGRVTGPHLHWGVKLGGARVDPATLPGLLL